MIEALSSNPFALSASKGLFADVDLFAELLTVGRGLPGSKSLSFVSPKESNPRKSDPAHPPNPENRTCRVGGKELAPLLLIFRGWRGSNTFAADPPGRLDFRRD